MKKGKVVGRKNTDLKGLTSLQTTFKLIIFISESLHNIGVFELVDGGSSVYFSARRGGM